VGWFAPKVWRAISGRRAIQLAICGLAASLAPAAHAEPNLGDDKSTLLEKCWTPKQLAGTRGEIRPRRGKRTSPPGDDPEALKTPAAASNGVVRRVKLPEGKKLIALTFDLCELNYEVAGYDGRIVDYLRKNDVKATFFAGGKWLLTHPERTQQLMADPLFEIANHGWSHRNLQRLSGNNLANEIGHAQKAYRKVRSQFSERACIAPNALSAAALPERMTLFRFPYGTCAPKALKAVASAGLMPIQWDVSTGDPWPGQSAKRIASHVLRSVKPGSIVLAHANGRGWHTAQALPMFIPKLKAQGYEFVTVSELLAAGEPEMAPKCFDQRPGDTERWVRNSATKKKRRRSWPAKRVWNPFQR